jgi:DNA-binding CsgD family transcriptional regulator
MSPALTTDACQQADAGPVLEAAHPLYTVDLDQRITSWNDCASRDLRAGDDLIGRRCYEVLATIDPRNAALCRPNCPVITQARNSSPATDFEVWAQSPDGKSAPVRVSILLAESGERADTRVVHMVRPVEERPRSVVGARGIRPRMPRSFKQVENHDERPPITPRQIAALRLLAEGCSPDEIAGALNVRPITVRNHIQAAMDRLGARTRLEAVILASRTGLLGDPD